MPGTVSNKLSIVVLILLLPTSLSQPDFFNKLKMLTVSLMCLDHCFQLELMEIRIDFQICKFQARVIASISSPSIMTPMYNRDFHWGKACLVISRDSFHSRYCLICILASNKDKIYSNHMIVVCFYLMVTITFSRSADG